MNVNWYLKIVNYDIRITVKIITSSDSTTIQTCMAALDRGELLVLPSDTVYGLAVDATNKQAVQKLINFKRRPVGKAISIYVKDLEDAKTYVEISEKQQNTLEQILPGPFTIVLTSKGITVPELEEKGTLGIRMPQFSFINELVKAYKKPITATSANISGDSPHYSIESLLKSLSHDRQQMLDLIVDHGKLPFNKPSTVIDLSTHEIKTLRAGDLSLTQLKSAHTHTQEETAQFAKEVFKELVIEDKPLVILLEGELGAGKTIFVKAIAETLGLHDVDSPSYVIFNEYDIAQNKKFIHFDLYNILDTNEYQYLHIDTYLKPGNILCFEWGDKAEEIYSLLKERSTIVFVKIEYINSTERNIEVSTLKKS